MKKLFFALALLMGIAGMGLWWLLGYRHTEPEAGEVRQMILMEKAGAGTALHLLDSPIPLRTVRPLLCPRQELVIQIVTQTDRQKLILIREGQIVESVEIPKPSGISDIFWRFAILADAYIQPNEKGVFLYQSGTGGRSEEDPSLLLVWDFKEQSFWSIRTPAERMALSPRGEAVFLFGSRTAVQRIPLKVKVAQAGAAPTPKSYLLPEELGQVQDLLPTGEWNFLVAHSKGLSTPGKETWSHTPLPGEIPSHFPEAKARLARSQNSFFWQPFPGSLHEVAADASLLQDHSAFLHQENSPIQDHACYQLLGTDPSGLLWFNLADPHIRAPANPLPIASSEEGWENEAPPKALTDESHAAWASHLAKDRDRLYVWNPTSQTIQKLVWTEYWPALGAPPSVPCPKNAVSFNPSTSAILFGEGKLRWNLPLSRLAGP